MANTKELIIHNADKDLAAAYRKQLNKIQKKLENKETPDTGIDIYALENTIIKGGVTSLVKTGLKITLPDGYRAKVEGRSGLAAKEGIFPVGGIIDNEYTGEIGVILYLTPISNKTNPNSINNAQRSYRINKGDRIAQLVIQKVGLEDIKGFSATVKEPSRKTDRSEKGFGSSGK